MTALELFERAAPHVAPALETTFGHRSLCILTTRVVMDVAKYFGIQVRPLPVRVMVYNAAFDKHKSYLDPKDVKSWPDGAWSVGLGYGKYPEPNKWNGHLIAIADGIFGDFNIQQAERLEKNIITGTAAIGPYRGEPHWFGYNEAGTVAEFFRIEDETFRNGPDWRDPKRRRPLVGAIIRAIR